MRLAPLLLVYPVAGWPSSRSRSAAAGVRRLQASSASLLGPAPGKLRLPFARPLLQLRSLGGLLCSPLQPSLCWGAGSLLASPTSAGPSQTGVRCLRAPCPPRAGSRRRLHVRSWPPKTQASPPQPGGEGERAGGTLQKNGGALLSRGPSDQPPEEVTDDNGHGQTASAERRGDLNQGQTRLPGDLPTGVGRPSKTDPSRPHYPA